MSLLIGLERPIAFHPQLARLFGINGALFLGQILYWSDKGSRGDGWIYKTKEDIENETTLSVRQQDYCVKTLTQSGVLMTRVMRVDETPIKHYKVDSDVLQRLIFEDLRIDPVLGSKNAFSESDKMSLSESDKMSLSIESDKMSLSNIRTETTTETTETSYEVSPPASENPPELTESQQRDLACAEWMFSLILALNPNHKKPQFDSWAKTIRLMRERDGRAHEDIARVFSWANADPFWRTNILSPEKLRKQWDTLEIQMRHGHERNQRVPGPSKSDGHRVANRLIDEDIRRSARALGGGLHGADALDVRREVDGEVLNRL